MKKAVIICSMLGYSQLVKSSADSLAKTFDRGTVFGLGFGYSFIQDNEIRPYGIDLINSSTRGGPHLRAGYRLDYKNIIGFRIEGNVNIFNIKKKKLEPEIENRFPEYSLEGDEYLGGGKIDGLFNISSNGFVLGAYPLLHSKRTLFAPFAGAAFLHTRINKGSYILREKGTNYFTKYTIETNRDWSPGFTCGLEIKRGTTGYGKTRKGEMKEQQIYYGLSLRYTSTRFSAQYEIMESSFQAGDVITTYSCNLPIRFLTLTFALEF